MRLWRIASSVTVGQNGQLTFMRALGAQSATTGFQLESAAGKAGRFRSALGGIPAQIGVVVALTYTIEKGYELTRKFRTTKKQETQKTALAWKARSRWQNFVRATLRAAANPKSFEEGRRKQPSSRLIKVVAEGDVRDSSRTPSGGNSWRRLRKPVLFFRKQLGRVSNAQSSQPLRCGFRPQAAAAFSNSELRNCATSV